MRVVSPRIVCFQFMESFKPTGKLWWAYWTCFWVAKNGSILWKIADSRIDGSKDLSDTVTRCSISNSFPVRLMECHQIIWLPSYSNPTIQGTLDTISLYTHAPYLARIPEDCIIVLECNGNVIQLVHETGKLFDSKMKQLLVVHEGYYDRLHVSPIRLEIINPWIAKHQFFGVNQVKVVNKFFFNSLPATMRTLKMFYSYVLIFYDFVTNVMPWDVVKFLHSVDSENILFRTLD